MGAISQVGSESPFASARFSWCAECSCMLPRGSRLQLRGCSFNSHGNGRIELRDREAVIDPIVSCFKRIQNLTVEYTFKKSYFSLPKRKRNPIV